MNKTLTVHDFEILSGIKSANLRYYDALGILSPRNRRDNNYREYSALQLETAWTIESLRQMRVPLKTIKKYIQNRTQQNAIDLLTHQKRKIDEEIDKLLQLKNRLSNLLDEFELGKDFVIPKIVLEERETESIRIGPEVGLENSCEPVAEFIRICRETEVALIDDVSLILNSQAVEKKLWDGTCRLYIKSPRGNYKTEPGLYLVSYDYRFNTVNGAHFDKIASYIEDNGLSICGDIYAECPLAEITTDDSNYYLVRISVRVEKSNL